MTFLSNAEVSVWYCHGLSASHHHNIQELSRILSGTLVLDSLPSPVHEETSLKEFKGRMLPTAPSSTLTVTLSMPLQCGSFSCNTVRILVLPLGSVSLLMLATDFDLEMVENDFLRNSVLSSCCPWGSSKWSWKEADSMLWALLVTSWLLDLERGGLPLPLHPLDVLWDFLFPEPVCLDLQHELKWFLLPHLWHFLPHTGHSLGRWDILHLPHVLPWLSLALWPWPWPWPFLWWKVLIWSMVVAIATPPLDLCWLKSLMVASCCLACWSSLSNVTLLFCAVCDLTHFLTSKCFIAWKSSSSQCLVFSSCDV